MPRSRSDGERKLYKTGDVLKRSGLNRSTLYMYTTMGLVEEARTTSSGQRLFDEAVFRRIKLIQDLLAHGYTLRDVKDIFFK